MEGTEHQAKLGSQVHEADEVKLRNSDQIFKNIPKFKVSFIQAGIEERFMDTRRHPMKSDVHHLILLPFALLQTGVT